MVHCGGCSNRGGALLCVITTPETFGDGGTFRVTGVGWFDEMPAWLCARTPGSWSAIPSMTGATLRGKYARLTQSMPSPGRPSWIVAFHCAKRAEGASMAAPDFV